MGVVKKIKKYFHKKEKLKQLKTENIPNLNFFDSDKRTIVFVSGALPTHDKDSGSNRLLEIILAFKNQNYNCILSVENVFENDKYVQFYKNLGIIVYVESNKFKNLTTFLGSIKTIDYIWFYGPNTLKTHLENLSKRFPNAKSIFDMVDIHFLRYKRAIELNPSKISLKKRYNKYFKIETQLAKKADIVVAISEKEKGFMHKYLPESNIIIISNVHYPKVDKHSVPTFEERKDILFIGSAHTPNIDAVHYLYNKIMPLVWKKLPEINVNIIGNVKECIDSINHPNFHFLGFVENVESYFFNSRLMVAPLTYGAGVKGKIGQAFEFYLPVVTTSIGAEGMFLIDKINADITDDTNEFAERIINTYSNKSHWNLLSNNSEKSLYPFSKEKLNETIIDL
ncbi:MULTISPECIES: glycosyltransferase [Flavobacterium]|uniref:Glycosyltransferase n=1 Tax=Flavobacterium hankyongi TaxID=1176532 RepID=A0ABP9AAJ9_9FLAO|nr:glycosyltransferase family 4 protein [Flavobacterium sp. N1846]